MTLGSPAINATRRQTGVSYPRENVRWLASWSYPGGLLHPGELQDVSPKGAFVKTDDPCKELPSVGSTIDLVFASANIGSVATRSIVQWTGFSRAHGCSGFGVQFEEVNSTVSAYLLR